MYLDSMQDYIISRNICVKVGFVQHLSRGVVCWTIALEHVRLGWTHSCFLWWIICHPWGFSCSHHRCVTVEHRVTESVECSSSRTGKTLFWCIGLHDLHCWYWHVLPGIYWEFTTIFGAISKIIELLVAKHICCKWNSSCNITLLIIA